VLGERREIVEIDRTPARALHADQVVAPCNGNPRRDIEVGGPEILTRREEVELAFAAVRRRPRVLRVPPPLLKAVLPAIGLADRRRGEMLGFLAAISCTDTLAPPHGSRLLGDYLREHA
jgi:hypothetical protein